eukprot:9471337-Pyramimonas_sp.AAC.1
MARIMLRELAWHLKNELLKLMDGGLWSLLSASAWAVVGVAAAMGGARPTAATARSNDHCPPRQPLPTGS